MIPTNSQPPETGRHGFAARRGGFSLIEVILAIGVFSLTIVAVIGLLGPVTRQIRDLQDLKVANTLPAPIREELNRMGFDSFVNDALTAILPDWTVADGQSVPADETAVATLVATADGGEVAEIDSDRVEPGGQYFSIQVIKPEAGSNLEYKEGDAYVAFKILVSWPYRLPPDGEAVVDIENRRTFEYFTAIVMGEPF